MQIALLGNPNTGKSSIFNILTGMHQHVGNFPGVTVDKKTGTIQLNNETHKLVDFPGTYSIYPHSKDEEVVYDTLFNPSSEAYPDLALVVVDASNLRRNLFLFSQIYDLGIPTIMVLNMSDLAVKKGININLELLQKRFLHATIVSSNARVGMGKDRILDAIKNVIQAKKSETKVERSEFLKTCIPAEKNDFSQQEKEASERYVLIDELLKTVVNERILNAETKTNKLDKILVHPVWGYLIFAGILMIIFQFIFAFATIPMDYIEHAFGLISNWTANNLPTGVFNDLLSQGIIPGIGGVVVFIPQIALLFFFISILEESGYLARVVFIMDRLMRPFGLNGKSVVPLMSSVACAIPGIMATRTIADWKERLITILVAPLMSCSARIPVYTLLISLVIPNKMVLGFFNLQGLVLFGLYFLGLASALAVSIILKWIIRTKDKGFLLLELPSYKLPRMGNVGLTVFEKVRIFVFDAGKVILAISIILWALASYGPSDRIQKAENLARKTVIEKQLNNEEAQQFIASAKLENSYIGIMGKGIEPLIKPLGYDWKIGISLITSFAAREVFVGSLATIYAVYDDGATNKTLIEKLRYEKLANGKPVYTLASGLSLMVFYVFAMQCMATLAVVKRETKSWKWPLIQVGYMGAMAYFFAWIIFSIFN